MALNKFVKLSAKNHRWLKKHLEFVKIDVSREFPDISTPRQCLNDVVTMLIKNYEQKLGPAQPPL